MNIKSSQIDKIAGPAKSDFDLLVRFLPEVYFTCPYDIFIVNS